MILSIGKNGWKCHGLEGSQIGVPGGLPSNGGEGLLNEGVNDGRKFLEKRISVTGEDLWAHGSSYSFVSIIASQKMFVHSVVFKHFILSKMSVTIQSYFNIIHCSL